MVKKEENTICICKKDCSFIFETQNDNHDFTVLAIQATITEIDHTALFSRETYIHVGKIWCVFNLMLNSHVTLSSTSD